jgi:hypothetical protein
VRPARRSSASRVFAACYRAPWDRSKTKASGKYIVVAARASSKVCNSTHYTNIRLGVLLPDGAEDLVPIRAAKVRRCTQGGDGVRLRADVVDLEK